MSRDYWSLLNYSAISCLSRKKKIISSSHKTQFNKDIYLCIKNVLKRKQHFSHLVPKVFARNELTYMMGIHLNNTHCSTLKSLFTLLAIFVRSEINHSLHILICTICFHWYFWLHLGINRMRVAHCWPLSKRVRLRFRRYLHFPAAIFDAFVLNCR